MDAVANPIKIIVKGSDNHGNDAPTVKDLFNQILEHLKILREVETEIFGKGQVQLEWRVGNWTKNSPLAVEIMPFPKERGINIDNRANKVVGATAYGLRKLGRGSERPRYFTDKIIRRVNRINVRVTNGLASTEIDFSGYEGVPSFSTNPEFAHTIIENIKILKERNEKPYRELSSVEGYVKAFEYNKDGQFVITLTARIDDRDIKCTSSDAGLDNIESLAVGEVINGLRVRVFGILYYKILGVIDRVDAERVELFTPRDQLPTIEDLIDPDFTNGVDSVEYIRRMRDNV